MNLPEVPPLHEIRKLELKYRFLFMLRDLGVASARQPAIDTWSEYIEIVGQLVLNEMPDSQ